MNCRQTIQLISTTTTSLTRSLSSLPLQSFVTALAMFQVRSHDWTQWHLYHASSGTLLGVSATFLLLTSSEGPLLSSPTHCRRAAVSGTPVICISRRTAWTPSCRYSQQQGRIFKHPAHFPPSNQPHDTPHSLATRAHHPLCGDFSPPFGFWNLPGILTRPQGTEGKHV